MSSPIKRPQRTCLGCRQTVDQDHLIRYVLSPEGEVLIDYMRKLPGKGVYTHLDVQCLRNAVRQRQFDRAFKGKNNKVDDASLVEALKGRLMERVLGLLGMARKSGQAISGSNQVLEALTHDSALGLIVLARDVSAGIRERVAGRVRNCNVEAWQLFSKQVLGQVLGKEERSVVAVKAGPLAETIKKEISRYMHIAGES